MMSVMFAAESFSGTVDTGKERGVRSG